MKLESLVIVDQHATVNTFPGLVHTARHVKKMKLKIIQHINELVLQQLIVRHHLLSERM